jgi:hypothetical protein
VRVTGQPLSQGGTHHQRHSAEGKIDAAGFHLGELIFSAQKKRGGGNSLSAFHFDGFRDWWFLQTRVGTTEMEETQQEGAMDELRGHPPL